MTHTEEDLLDLYTCLQDIGLAETPYEEAERLRTEARESFRKSLEPQLDITKWLLAKSYPHTYVLTLRQSSLTKVMTTALFPVVRGHILCTSITYSIDEFEFYFSPMVQSIHYFSSLKGLKQGLLDLSKTYPTVTPDKYPFLDIV